MKKYIIKNIYHRGFQGDRSGHNVTNSDRTTVSCSRTKTQQMCSFFTVERTDTLSVESFRISMCAYELRSRCPCVCSETDGGAENPVPTGHALEFKMQIKSITEAHPCEDAGSR